MRKSCDLLAASVMCAGSGWVVHASPTCSICSSYANPLPRMAEMWDQLGETTGAQEGRSSYLALPMCALDLHLGDLSVWACWLTPVFLTETGRSQVQGYPGLVDHQLLVHPKIPPPLITRKHIKSNTMLHSFHSKWLS